MVERGKFIVMEGVDNCGKTTQSRMLAKYLSSLQIPVVRTREPGGTWIGEELRKILTEDRPKMLDPITQTLLFYAARREFLTERVAPRLEEGYTVIADRFEASTYVYQGHVQHVNQALLDVLHRSLVGEDLRPDITFVIDITAEESIKRDENEDNQGQQLVFEKQGLEFRQKLCNGYIEFANDQRRVHDNRNIYVIDGVRPIELVHYDIAGITSRYFERIKHG